MGHQEKNKGWKEGLKNRYRLVVLNDDTYEEVSSFILSRINIYIIITTILMCIILSVTAIIVYTPIKEYLPGLDRTKLKYDVRALNTQILLIEDSLRARQLFIENILRVLKGKHDTTGFNEKIELAKHDSIDVNKVTYEDSMLRLEVEKENEFTLFDKSDIKDIEALLFHLFTPVKGVISREYEQAKGHFGVDIVAHQNSNIKAALDGIVIFSDWTLDDGFVVAVQHNNDLISFYKHNSVLHKKSGNFVEAGEVLAVIGNTGESTDGIHLHFELWYKGTSIDPTEYLSLN